MTPSPVVLGLDFGGTKIAVAVSDMSGARLGHASVDTLAQAGAAAALTRGIDAASDLLATVGEGRELAGVGAATFGIPFDDRVELSPNVPGWSSVPFGAALREAFPGVPLAMATDVKAAAAAELRWGALAGADPGIYLNLGTGLAAAIVAGDAVITGAHGASGEIGYNLRTIDDVWQPKDAHPILEDAVSGQALATTGSARLNGQLSAADVFAHADDHPAAAAIVDDFIRELALHVVNLANAIDPVRIVVGGGMVASWSRFGPGLRSALDEAVPFAPELVCAQFPYDAPLIGALALGVEAAGAVLDEEAMA